MSPSEPSVSAGLNTGIEFFEMRERATEINIKNAHQTIEIEKET